MGKHAVLSPSKSSMWLNCTPSARLSEGHDTSSEAADEGTLAHNVSELLLKRALRRINDKEFIEEMKGHKANKFYSPSLLEHCEQFASFVMERYAELQCIHGHATIFLEVNLDLRKFIPQGFGTGDVIIVAGNVVKVIDLKYGKGVLVEAKGNTQMKIYALGSLDTLSMFIHGVEMVEMTIYQPRLDNIDTWSIQAKELVHWAKTVLKVKAELAFKGVGDRVAGSHCKFCPVKVTCKANADYNLTFAGKDFEDLGKVEELSNDELVDIYTKAKQIRNWLSSIEEYMLKKALAGKTWKGLKLVNGRSVRVISDPEKLLKILKSKKIPASKYLSEPQLLGVTALEKNIGAQRLQELAGKLLIKPKGKPSLVPAERKGQNFDVNESAKEDFS